METGEELPRIYETLTPAQGLALVRAHLAQDDGAVLALTAGLGTEGHQAATAVAAGVAWFFRHMGTGDQRMVEVMELCLQRHPDLGYPVP
jgi:hypothetical protein